MEPVKFGEQPEEQRTPNRRERRAHASKVRKQARQVTKRLNERARKVFERTAQEMRAEDNPDVAEQYGFK